jgi:thiamine-monophosphate kinase
MSGVMINEAKIIKSLIADSNGFIGDDAAVLPRESSEHYCITKDMLVEDIHFRTSYFNAKDMAHKALQVNLSDLAAMGAKPKYILCGLSIPVHHGEYAQLFLQNLVVLCKKANVTLIGGDTTKSPDKLYISITAIGISSSEHLKYRHMAKDGDIICVVGNLGWAHLGLIALENSLLIANEYKEAFLRPKAKVNEGIWLGQQSCVTSMMDISDGLYIDLKRLCEASSVAGVMNLEKLESNSDFSSVCASLELDPIDTMLTGGEDYGLLFTISAESFEHLAHNFYSIFGYKIKCIGTITSGSSVSFKKNDEFIDLDIKPFTHFGEKL